VDEDGVDGVDGDGGVDGVDDVDEVVRDGSQVDWISMDQDEMRFEVERTGEALKRDPDLTFSAKALNGLDVQVHRFVASRIIRS